MTDFPVLTFTIFLPLIGALFIFLFVREGKQSNLQSVSTNSRNLALWTTIVTFVLSLSLWLRFDPKTHEFQFQERFQWVEGYDIFYFIGVDGISLFFVLLTTFLMPICVLASWNIITKQVREYMIAFLLLESFIIGVFCALDAVLFYVFFEATLIPMFLIIGIWGGENRIYAAFKFFLYTLVGSVLLLLAFIYMYNEANTTDMLLLMERVPYFDVEIQKWLWLALFASFAVKVPMWPVHTWLPDAHVQAPTAGSVVLAGVLIKIGAYGFLRFSLPMLPAASIDFAPLIFTLSILAIILTSLIALMQKDMKKLIAYSSVAHMGFVTIGIFTFNQHGIEGGVIQMISHGIISSALFLVVGSLYNRLHTKEIAKMGGIVEQMPRFAAFFMVFMLGSVALPGTSGFVGEFLVLLGVFHVNKLVAALAATGVILGAAYMLWLYARTIYGDIHNREVKKLEDVNTIEWIIYLPLVFLVIFIGIYPSVITTILDASVSHLVEQVQQGSVLLDQFEKVK